MKTIFKRPKRNWWDFMLETLHSIGNKFYFEQPMLLAEQVKKKHIFLHYMLWELINTMPRWQVSKQSITMIFRQILGKKSYLSPASENYTPRRSKKGGYRVWICWSLFCRKVSSKAEICPITTNLTFTDMELNRATVTQRFSVTNGLSY
jgi:hypothetical protein